MTWVGLGGIVVASIAFTDSTRYPGSAVALPVVGAALVIAGGMARPSMGAERLLRLPPFQWMGRLSYSLYLWHWPILIIASQHVGHALSLEDNLLWLLLALGLSILSFVLIENPIRRWRLLVHSAGRSICLGVLLIAISLIVVRYELVNHSAVAAPVPSASTTTSAPPSASTSSTAPTAVAPSRER